MKSVPQVMLPRSESSLVRQAGFSLVELSIVMIIVGLMLGMGIQVFGPAFRQALKEKNEAIVARAIRSVIGFAGSEGQIPTGDGFFQVVASNRDAQNAKLLYAFDPLLDDRPGEICRRNRASLRVRLPGDKTTVNNVAFVVWSKGYDGVGNLGLTPGEVADDTEVTLASYSDDNDDLVGWATLYELKAAAQCGPALKIITQSLPNPSAKSGSYAAAIHAEGGVKGQPGELLGWCLEEQTGSISKHFLVSAMQGKKGERLPPSTGCSHQSGFWKLGQFVTIKRNAAPPSIGSARFTLHVRDQSQSEPAGKSYDAKSFAINYGL
ncbi:MAG: type II secretion system protein [Magnetococcales bacterium]|nr:type II secretion system protein [Magnetococcales bacterium]